MSDVVIHAEGVGKRYRIGTLERYATLRDSLTGAFTATWRAVIGLTGRGRDSAAADGASHVWALREATFDVRAGEVVGIIGSNGAGKTTLLKILSRITDPTEGWIRLTGRVGSLLEVGTGFHPELTGRENIYLSGAIQGMGRDEIARKFDEIVAFADVERFIDTPVKRYSSGMYLRLAFGVAAHLEPEILLVDEVLAVGDAAFQRKCLGKMRQVAGGGRTVLFVSHNMGAIQQLCPRTLWLDGGRLVRDGPTAEVVQAYLTASDDAVVGGAAAYPEDPSKDSQLRSVRLLNIRGRPFQRFSVDEPIVIEFAYQVHRRAPGLYGCLQISRRDGTPVLVSYSHDHAPDPLDDLSRGTHVLRVTVPPRTLGHGDYLLHFSIARGRLGTTIVDDCGIVATFTLDDLATLSGNNRIGHFSTLLPWDVFEPAASRDVAAEV